MWQGSANRLTTFTASNGVTTTLDYDSSGRITRRTNALGYSEYVYEDGTDWLVRETWHSAISGNTFDLSRYWYVNGRPSRVEYFATGPSDLSTVWSYRIHYFQYNWHGDVTTFVGPNGDGGNGYWYDPWGGPLQTTPTTWNYYRWNGGWGYLTFDALQLYYVHGRWYDLDTGLWLSPDENGGYIYNQQDAVNSAQGDPCENHKPPVTPPAGGMTVDWIRDNPNPLNTFPIGEIESIGRLKNDILGCAARHNTIKTNMDDDAFAALMTAILHIEGKLPGNGKTPADQQRDRDNDFYATFGFNGSSGVAKISQSVAIQILRGEIPGMPGKYCYSIAGGYPEAGAFAQIGGAACDSRGCWDARFIPVASELAHPELSLEYLAANLERGADRVNTLGYQASVFNLAAWHNAGVQTPQEFSQPPNGPKGASYGNVTLSLMPTAMRILGRPGKYLPYNSFERGFVTPPGLGPR